MFLSNCLDLWYENSQQEIPRIFSDPERNKEEYLFQNPVFVIGDYREIIFKDMSGFLIR